MPMIDGKYVPVTRTETRQVKEWLGQEIDWEGFPWGNDFRSSSDPEGQKEAHRTRLQQCEASFRAGLPVYASNYGGCPRIWHKVLDVGMGVHWPWWKPRPIVVVNGTLGAEWYDWDTLTDVEVRGEQEARVLAEGAKEKP